ncbi:MAG: hypothetical protein NTW07_07585 [candidate division Zixibacteria bacterium]|nr:hypothetical protein [candidate division Zixibacteria bacterium]
MSKLDVAYMNLPAIQSGAWLAFFFVGIAALVVWLSRQGKGARALMLVLVALPVVDGLRFDSRFVKMVEPRYFDSKYAENGLTKFLAGQKERPRFLNISGPNEVKDADLPVHGIDVTVGYHGNQLRWYDDLLGGPNLTNVYPQLNARLGNLTGTRFLIAATENMPPPDHFGPLSLQKVADLGGNLQFLRNDNAFPRVYLTDQYRVIPERNAMVSEVLNGTTDMRKVVLLEEEPSIPIVADAMSSDSAWIIDYQPETVRIGVSASHNSILVLTDTWFNSWQVTVDGRSTRCLRAYGAFRAVEIPAGSREVRFEYHSSRYAAGKVVTWLTVFFLLGIISVSTWRDGRLAPMKKTTATETD